MRKIQPDCILFILLVLFALAWPAKVLAGKESSLDSLLGALKTTKDDSLRIALLIDISQASVRNHIGLSVEYAQQAVNEATQTKSNKLLGLALDNAVRICFLQGLMDITADYLTRYMTLMEAEGNAAELSKARTNIGSLWLLMEKYELAEQAYLNWLRDHEGKSDAKKADLVSIYSNMGILKTAQGKFEEAAKYFEKGIETQGKEGVENHYFMKLLINYGDLLVKQQDFDRAFEKLSRVLEISRQQSDKPFESVVLMSLGKAHEAAGKQQKAIGFYNDSYKIASETGNISMLEASAFMLYKTYEKVGSADSTLKYLTIYNKYNKEKKTEEAKEKLIREELTAEFRKRENAQQAHQKASRLRMLLLLMLLISIASFAVWHSFRARKRLDQANLSKMNLELSGRRLELDNELLMAEVEQKNKELAVKVVYDIQKNELIGHVVDKLLEQSKVKQGGNPAAISDIIRELEKSREEHIWEDFEIRFKQVHHSFYKELQQINPALTPNERRLCAFLKLNMSTKEISTITGQTPHSIKIARTRLRKKLNLTNTEQGLVEFLASIG
jgi:tetratricopeptide (TPR) repeat protein/DNA-binding CsgD family transcriptional regulator